MRPRPYTLRPEGRSPGPSLSRLARHVFPCQITKIEAVNGAEFPPIPWCSYPTPNRRTMGNVMRLSGKVWCPWANPQPALECGRPLVARVLPEHYGRPHGPYLITRYPNIKAAGIVWRPIALISFCICI
jgi:hypothetical protein